MEQKKLVFNKVSWIYDTLLADYEFYFLMDTLMIVGLINYMIKNWLIYQKMTKCISHNTIRMWWKIRSKKNQDLNTKKLLFRLPVWLTQMKAENNW